MKLLLQIGDRERSARVLRRGDHLTVAFDDGPEVRLRLLAAGDGGFELELDGRRIHGAGAVLDGDDRQLWVNGRTLTFVRAQAAGSRREAAADTGLAAHIPAVVLEVLVAPGDIVKPGQKLVLLESMKMVMPIKATRSGVVRALLCAPGDAVEPGRALVEIEEDLPRP